ncbi:hypothetical protein PWT90_00835 [Aphanocladium album]|nr:hypothetical protein PWT90_00835 [Aphanocladium album]
MLGHIFGKTTSSSSSTPHHKRVIRDAPRSSAVRSPDHPSADSQVLAPVQGATSIPQPALIENLRIAFSKIGWDGIAFELEQLSSPSQKLLIETLQARLPIETQHDIASTPISLDSDPQASRTRGLGVDDLRAVHQEEKLKLESEINELRQKTSDLYTQLEASNNMLQTLQRNERALLDAILEKSGGEELLDDDLVSLFSGLRQKVQRLANSRLYAYDGQLSFPIDATPSANSRFYRTWADASRKDRILLTRMWMFNFLRDHILDYNLFGLANISAGADDKKQRFLSVEKSLDWFEDELHTRSRVSKQDIVNWRVATIKCTQACQQDHSFGDHLGANMYTIFERLLIKLPEVAEIEKLKQQFSQLCRDAIKFRLLMRGSEDDYRCLSLENGALLSSYEDVADVSGVWDGEDRDMGLGVAFTLFGALVKYPKRGSGEVILEKALVVMDPKLHEADKSI